jgi:hypothetical protein
LLVHRHSPTLPASERAERSFVARVRKFIDRERAETGRDDVMILGTASKAVEKAREPEETAREELVMVGSKSDGPIAGPQPAGPAEEILFIE